MGKRAADQNLAYLQTIARFAAVLVGSYLVQRGMDGSWVELIAGIAVASVSLLHGLMDKRKRHR